MTITQITSSPDRNNRAFVIGLGDDQKIYYWINKAWSLYQY